MRLRSLKTQIVLSFIALEVLFFSIIIALGFSTLNTLSKTLIDEKIEVASKLFLESLKTSLILSDFAAIDNQVELFASQNEINSIAILDPHKAVISKSVTSLPMIEDEHNSVRTFAVVYNETPLGELIVSYDNSQELEIIKKRKLRILLMMFALMSLGAFLAYKMAQRVERSLQRLTNIAQGVAYERHMSIDVNSAPNKDLRELFIMMRIMQSNIENRTARLNETLKNLEQMNYAIDVSAIVSKTDSKGLITYVNESFSAISGYSKEELYGFTHKVVAHEDTPNELYKALWDSLEQKLPFKTIFKNKTKSGSDYYIDSTLIPIVDAKNEIKEVIALSYDVSGLVQAREEAKQAEKAKGQFLSNMSHEIRTPLNGIIGFVNVLDQKNHDQESKRYLSIIQESSKSLLQIINDILDYSKIQEGKFIINPYSVDSKQFFETLFSFFEQQSKLKSINYRLEVDETIPATLIMDADRVKQVVLNFLSNAFKFTPEQGTITLRVSWSDKKELLGIVVEDSGIGIAPKDQKKIFNSFEQADGSTTRKYGGTGLGLAISVKLIELMNGTLTLKSQKAKGSSFEMHIPISYSHEHLEALEEQTQALKTFKGHLLVVEDNKTNQMLIGVLLESFGLSYEMANDGLEAVEAFKLGSFDLVLMDESMPNLNGIEAFKRIRAFEEEQKQKKTPVCALTANVMIEDQERFKVAGMDGFLAKPIDTKALMSLLEEFLKLS